MLSPNHSGKRKYNLERITPHCTAVSVTAKRIGEIFANPSRNASCNYGIGKDKKIVCVVEEENRSWCSSSPDNDNRAITVECSSSNVAPYQFDDGVFEKLIELCVDICARYGKDRLIWISDKNTALNYKVKDNELLLTVHRWFASKACPGQWCMDRMQMLADRVTSALSGSSSKVTYTTKKGDTLSKIAKAFGTTVNAIASANGITNPNKIGANVTLIIPQEENKQYHIVNKADGLTSLSKIAKANGITLAEIKELNPQVKAPLYIIHVGDKIRVK